MNDWCSVHLVGWFFSNHQGIFTVYMTRASNLDLALRTKIKSSKIYVIVNFYPSFWE